MFTLDKGPENLKLLLLNKQTDFASFLLKIIRKKTIHVSKIVMQRYVFSSSLTIITIGSEITVFIFFHIARS